MRDGLWRVSARTGWSLLFIWFGWLKETNQMNKTGQMNQINPHPSRRSRQPRSAIIMQAARIQDLSSANR